MRLCRVVVLGSGPVGAALLGRMLEHDSWWAGREGFSFLPSVFLGEGRGSRFLPIERGANLSNFLAAASPVQPEEDALLDALGSSFGIVVDAAPSWATTPLLAAAVRNGHAAVLASDGPLVGGVSTFRLLTADRRTRFEAALACGLPLATALEAAVDCGDEVLGVEVELPVAAPGDSAPASERARRQALVLARVLGADLRLEAVRLREAGTEIEASAGRARVRIRKSADSESSVRASLSTALHRGEPLVFSGSAPSSAALAAALLRDLLALAREEEKPWRADRRARRAARAVSSWLHVHQADGLSGPGTLVGGLDHPSAGEGDARG